MKFWLIKHMLIFHSCHCYSSLILSIFRALLVPTASLCKHPRESRVKKAAHNTREPSEVIMLVIVDSYSLEPRTRQEERRFSIMIMILKFPPLPVTSSRWHVLLMEWHSEMWDRGETWSSCRYAVTTLDEFPSTFTTAIHTHSVFTENYTLTISRSLALTRRSTQDMTHTRCVCVCISTSLV
jgi:hypothetical protein